MIHFDGDALVYMAGFAADSRNGPFSHGAYNIKLIIKKALKMTQETTFKIFLTSTNPTVNFRTHIYEKYKKNRVKQCKNSNCLSFNISKESYVDRVATKDSIMKRRMHNCLDCGQSVSSTKPVYYNRLRNYLVDKYSAVVCNWGEADDWLLVNRPKWVATHDKDIFQTKGNYYNLKSGKVIQSDNELGKLYIKAKQIKNREGVKQFNKNGTKKLRKEIKGVGFKWFCYQMIYGDRVDNIIKIHKGDGPMYIYNNLNELKTLRECWNFVNMYYTKYSTEETMWLMAKLLWCAREPQQICSREVIEELIDYEESQ